MKDTVKLQRIKYPKYEVIWRNNKDEIEKYVFPTYNPRTKEDRIVEVSRECYYYLLDSTRCFENGSLVVVNDSEQKELLDDVKDKQGYTNNTHTLEDIKKLTSPKASNDKLKEELSKVTDLIEKQTIIKMCKEIGVDSASKQRIIVEALYGADVPVESIFEIE